MAKWRMERATWSDLGNVALLCLLAWLMFFGLARP